MLGNPLAVDIHRVFEKNIVNTSNIFNSYIAGATTEDKIMNVLSVP